MYYGTYPGYEMYRGCSDARKSACDNEITVTGKAKVSAFPDRLSVILGVVTEGQELKSVQQENTARMSQMITALKMMGIEEKDIRTNSYFINMLHDYVDNKQVFRGYRVTNTVKVEIKDIQKAGTIIDAAVSSGANLVENIEFYLSTPSVYYRRALSLAVIDATQKANIIAKTLNAEIDEVPVSVTEEVETYVPMAVKGVSTAFEEATPVKPGTIDMVASVRAVFKYED